MPARWAQNAVQAPITPAPTTTRSGAPLTGGGTRIASAKTTSARPVPRWVATTRPESADGRRRGSPPRASSSDPGSRRTDRPRGSPRTGRSRRPGTGRRPGRPPRRRSSRSRPGRRGRPVRASRSVITWRTGPNDTALITTSAPTTASREPGASRGAADPRGRPGRRAERLGSVRMAVEDLDGRPRQELADDREMGCGPARRRRGSRPGAAARRRCVARTDGSRPR